MFVQILTAAAPFGKVLAVPDQDIAFDPMADAHGCELRNEVFPDLPGSTGYPVRTDGFFILRLWFVLSVLGSPRPPEFQEFCRLWLRTPRHGVPFPG